MAQSQAASNELVMSNEAIQASLSETPEEVTADPEHEGWQEPEDDLSAWQDEDNGEEQEASEDAPARKKGAPTVRKVKANGKIVDVDMADSEAVDRLLSLGLGARQVFSKADKLEKSNKSLTAQLAELQKYKDNWQKLESRKTDKAALYEAIFGTKWHDDIKADREYQERYNAASPAERQFMDYKRQLDDQKRQMDQERQERESARAAFDAEKDQLKLQSLKGVMTPELQRYDFTQKVKDEATGERMNKALWRLAIADLKEQYGDQDDIPPSAVRKAFRETHDMLWSNHKQAATQQVKQVVEKKKTAAKEQAQIASTRNYNTGKDHKDLAKIKDPVKLFKKMFG